MKQPRMRMAVAKTDFERDLLRSWKSEEPSADARQNAHAIFSAGIGTASIASTTKAAGAAKAFKMAALSASVPPKAATLGVGALGKWILASVIVTTAIGASVVRSKSFRETSPPIATAIQKNAPVASASAFDLQIPPPPPVASPETASPEIVPTSTPTAAPQKIVSHSISPPAIVATDPIAATEATAIDPARSSLALGEEVAAIDRARAASASGDYAGALSFLDAYDARFPHGALAQESAVLRIETLFQNGDTENGKLLAEHFLASNPSSPHAARIHALLHR